MERKKKIKIIEVLLLIVIIITTFIIGDTYSKYKEQVDTYYRVDMKKWLFKVNDKDIYAETSLTGVIEPTFVDSEYANDDILVPGRELYFDINLDYSQVNVKFDAIFKSEILNTDKLYDFKIFKYVEPEGEKTIRDGTEAISIRIDPMADRTTTSANIRVYMKWNDATNNDLNNLEDTQFKGETLEGIDNTNLRFRITLTLEQVV